MELSNVPKRDFGARSPNIGTSQENSADEDFPVSSLGDSLSCASQSREFGKEMTGHRRYRLWAGLGLYVLPEAFGAWAFRYSSRSISLIR